jgi:GTP-binding protein HflX
VLVHVADISHPEAEEQISAVESILAEMDLGDTPRLLALNKWEVLSADQQEVMRRVYPAGIPITALKRAGLTPLVAAILGLLPVEPLNGPPRDPNAPPDPRDRDSGEPVAIWEFEMGSDVVQ